MKNENHQPQRPADRDMKLTAFALGELNDGERAEFAAADDTERAAAESIARLGGLLRRVWHDEPCPPRSNDLRRSVEARLNERELVAPASHANVTLPPVVRTSGRWSMGRIWLPLSLAASLLLIGTLGVALRNRSAQVPPVAKFQPDELKDEANEDQSLPDGYSQTDDVQYYAPGPEFKLAREAAAMKAAKKRAQDEDADETAQLSDEAQLSIGTVQEMNKTKIPGDALDDDGYKLIDLGETDKGRAGASNSSADKGKNEAGDPSTLEKVRDEEEAREHLNRRPLVEQEAVDQLGEDGELTGGGRQGGGQRVTTKTREGWQSVGNGQAKPSDRNAKGIADMGYPPPGAGAKKKKKASDRQADTKPKQTHSDRTRVGAISTGRGRPDANSEEELTELSEENRAPLGQVPGSAPKKMAEKKRGGMMDEMGRGGMGGGAMGGMGAGGMGPSGRRGMGGHPRAGDFEFRNSPLDESMPDEGRGDGGAGERYVHLGGKLSQKARPSNAGLDRGGAAVHTGGQESLFASIDAEAYEPITENPFYSVVDRPLSTFSIDVDTASYANVRRFINTHALPPPNAVRIEEMINYFSYDYPQPEGDVPFSVTTEVAGCPWDADHRLLRVGLKGRTLDPARRPASNLVFLIDVSGSMNQPNKLPLVKQALQLLTEQLTENDRVAIVVYAGQSGLVLPPTTGNEREIICRAIATLTAGGSTNGGQGIQQAYEAAQAHFIPGGTNRVILATDGDFNVGVTDRGDLVRLIEEKAAGGVGLSALGFGAGNLKDATLEQLADRGNGNYAYIDTADEARKVLVEQLSGTLVTIAKDVKLQIEFNPAQVASYRLVGYENRVMRDRDFNDDRKDAGEIGAGHTVTALYELVPAGQSALGGVDALKYQRVPQLAEAAERNELGTLALRYKPPEGEKSTRIKHVIGDAGLPYGRASRDFKFAASVASCGMLLRSSQFAGNATWDAVIELAAEGVGEDPQGYRAEFLALVKMAKALAAQPSK
jgi:Ca-activated chloride channel family protein